MIITEAIRKLTVWMATVLILIAACQNYQTREPVVHDVILEISSEPYEKTEAAEAVDEEYTAEAVDEEYTAEAVDEEYTAEPEDEEYTAETEYKETVKNEDTVAYITPDFRGEIMEKQSQNPDTIGWLYIPDTEIDSVILKNPPEKMNNQYYLDVDFNGLPDKKGTFCTDYRNEFGNGSREDLSRITTIFGHSFDDNPDGELFARLKRFRDPQFAESHPYIFFSTAEENMVWEIFAVFDTTIELPYIQPDLTDDEFYDMIDVVGELSEYSYYSVVNPDNKILVLSTCTFSVKGHENLPEYNEYRFVIMAKLVGSDTKTLDEAVFVVNEPAAPDNVTELMSLWEPHTFPVTVSKRRDAVIKPAA